MIGRSKEVDRELSTVPTGSCNCVCVLGLYSTTRCSAGRITTAINPKRLNAETWALVKARRIYLEAVTMKFLYLAVLALAATGVQAVASSSLAALSLTLLGMNKPVMGFFGFFRRRSPKPASVIEEMSPQGPVEFPPSNLLQSGGFFSPFAGVNRGGFFPSFGNFPGGLFQNQFMPQTSQPSWTSPPKRPPFQQQQAKFPPQNMPFQQQSGRFPPQNMPFQQQSGRFPPQNVPFQPQQMHQFDQDFNQDFDSQSDSDREVRLEDEPQINTEEAESFFTLLAETDENKCISRLVCEMGADPQSSGVLGTTVGDIVGSLTDFPEGSKVQEYNQILQKGRTEGLSSCQSRFPSCDEESYQLMKDSQNEEPSNEA
ncbi:hypothetical protein AVEN_145575-1 [Araneus ventricosus]|uniref:Uncharacterized protein n=1 Tax=Araneus ventricosus TaxID=182803 RepID=A0A4Y2U3M0_ARAVE|nr:hypothetical protein AVEN_145575-1 [Araneus ventricosus]